MLSASASQAQTAPATPGRPATRWAVGVQAASYPRIAYANVPIGPAAYMRPWPVMLTVRYQASARVASEVGLLLRLEPERTSTTVSSTGTYRTTSRATTWALPLLARLQVVPFGSRRWELAAALGLMAVSAKYSEETTFTNAQNGQSQLQGSGRQSYQDVPLLVGIGGTYALTPHVSLTADARFAWSFLGTVVGRALSQRDDFVAPINPALSAGLSYQFGKPLP